MCLNTPKPAPPPAAAPAPPSDPPKAPVLNETVANERNLLNSKKGGTRSLRIDLANPALAGGTGLNIPNVG